MSLLILIGLALLMLILAASGITALLRRPRPTIPPQLPALALPAAGALLTLAALLDGGILAALPVPLGPVGGSGGIQLDALTGLFLLLGFLVAGFAEASAATGTRERAFRQFCLAALSLTMLSGDVFLLAIGGAATILLLGPGAADSRFGRISLLAAACLAGACALLASLAMRPAALLPDTGFSLLRAGLAGSHAGFGGTVLLPVLTAGAVVPLLGLWPCAGWHRRLCATSPAWTPPLASALGLFLLLRLLVDLAGSAPPAAWGYGLIALGLLSALLAGIAALNGERVRVVVGSLLGLQNALSVTAVGICLLAKADDLPLLATSALDAALLLVSVQLPAGLAALRLAQAMEEEAGAALLGRLGGLVQSMPYATLFVAVAGAMLAFVPPAGGFGGLWLLLQAALSVSRLLGPDLSALSALVVAGIVVAAGLSVLAWLRLAAVAALGRPRTPRGAAAQEIPRRLGRAVAVLLALPLLIGLLPGVWLRLASPIGLTLGVRSDADPAPLLRLVSTGGASSLSPLPLGALLALSIGTCLWASRRLAVQPERREPGWEGGMAPPPPWLPFGDPLTQVGPHTLTRALWSALDPVRPRLGRGAGLAGWRPAHRNAVRVRLRDGGAGLSRLLQARGGVLALVLLGLLLGMFGWWRTA